MTVDTLGDHGVVRMNDGELEGFLSSRRVGVLGLPAADGRPPLLRPLSFAFDGDGLYLLYADGSGGRTATLSERADTARFLVYSVETAFNWQSVLLSGHLDAIPEAKRDAAFEAAASAWRPDVIETAAETGDVGLFAFRIDERTGIKHRGLPDGFYGDR